MSIFDFLLGNISRIDVKIVKLFYIKRMLIPLGKLFVFELGIKLP